MPDLRGAQRQRQPYEHQNLLRYLLPRIPTRCCVDGNLGSSRSRCRTPSIHHGTNLNLLAWAGRISLCNRIARTLNAGYLLLLFPQYRGSSTPGLSLQRNGTNVHHLLQ